MDAISALADRGLITDDQRITLAGFCNRWNCSVFRALIEANIISESDFADQAADILNLPRVTNIRSNSFDKKSLGFLPFHFARSRACVVLGCDDSVGYQRIRVAIADPWDFQSRQIVEDLVQVNVEWCVGEYSDVIEAIDRHFPVSSIVPHFWETLSGNSSLKNFRD